MPLRAPEMSPAAQGGQCISICAGWPWPLQQTQAAHSGPAALCTAHRTSVRHAICQVTGSMQLEACTRRAVPSPAHPLSRAPHPYQGTVSLQPEHPPALQCGAS